MKRVYAIDYYRLLYQQSVKFYYPLDRGYPWHYLLFSQFKWYRRITRGLWQRLDEPGYSWLRVKELFELKGMIAEDYRKAKK